MHARAKHAVGAAGVEQGVPAAPAEEYVCVHCFKQFPGREALLMHARAKHAEGAAGVGQGAPAAPVQEGIRGGETGREVPEAAEHTVRAVPRTAQQACPCCGQKFATDTALLLHMHKLHPALECPVCGVAFRQAQDLLRHQRYVHVPVPCQHCRRLMPPLARLQTVHGH